MRLREIAVGAVLAILLAGGVALTVPPPAPVTVDVPAPTPVKLALAPVRSTPPATAASPAPVQPESGWRDMHAKYAGARNLRVFFYEALRKPGNGAYFYAMRVLETCGLVLKATPSALPPERRNAAEALRQRCDFTAEGLADAGRELAAARNIGLSTDPLLGSMFDYLSADGPEGGAKMLVAAFEQGNPEVIASLVAPAIEAQMAPAMTPERDSTALGVPYGATLVACRLGMDCGPDSVRTLELCMQMGWCGGSVPEALRRGLGKNFAALDGVATRVLRDIERRNARRLLPPGHG
ncbi:hypothetical protein [Massilia agri]|uniref:Sel1 repeat family protein n=1 Tax=Massilia agri TaxID=1886785 RepID=A0ABT2AHQ2_9BURK|nr:hypothetical protein [Massilia agri]MCS0595308.1 hypothetical protein [Massilia agri]